MNEVPPTSKPRNDDDGPFRVGDWEVDPSLLEVRKGADTRHLEPRVMELLVYLAHHAGRTVSRDEFLDNVWHDRFVVEAVLTQGISQLRRLFEDDPKSPHYIQTVHSRGYRLVAAVTWLESTQPEEDAPSRRAATKDRRLRFLIGGAATAVVALLAILATMNRPGAVEVSDGYSSIAVLPFENLSSSSDDYLAAGITDMLTTDLAKIPELKVISLASARRYQGPAGAIPEFAQKVDVKTVLKGSVSHSDGQLRVIAHLLSGQTGELLWAQSYDREAVDLLELQSDISYAVAREIQGQLSLDRVAQLAHRDEVDAEAYREYLKGRLYWNRRDRDLPKSKEHFESAIELAPNFSRAYAGLADAIIQLANYTMMHPQEAFPEADELVQRALELDPELAEAHATRGLIRTNRDWDWSAAEESYLRAIDLQPGYASAHQWYAECLSFMGRHEEALAQIRRAVELDPLSPLMQAVWGQRLNAAGDHQEAILKLEQAIEMDPALSWPHRELAYAYRRLGDVPGALAQRRPWLEKRGWSVEALSIVDQQIAARGDAGFWAARLDHLTSIEGRWVPAIEIAEAYAALGRSDEAFEWLTRAVDERSEYFPHLIKSPLFDSISEDPRFRDLLEESGVVRTGIAPVPR